MARGPASWVERVPSLGNPADKASRLEFDGYQGAVVLDAVPCLALFWQGLLEPERRPVNATRR
eukprot:3106766-Pyramimonas_sp.AAC.1